MAAAGCWSVWSRRASFAASLAGCTERRPGRRARSRLVGPLPDVGGPRAEPVSLELAVYGGRQRTAVYREDRWPRFAEERPEIDVRLTSYADAESAAGADRALRSTNESGPDVFLLDPAYLPRFVDPGAARAARHAAGGPRAPVRRRLPAGRAHRLSSATRGCSACRRRCRRSSSTTTGRSSRASASRRRGSCLPARRGDLDLGRLLRGAARQAALTDGFGPVKGVYLPPDLESLTAFVRSGGGEVVDDVFEPTSLTLASDGALTTIAEVVRLAREDHVRALGATRRTRRSPVDRFAAGPSSACSSAPARTCRGCGRSTGSASTPSRCRRFGRSRSVSRMAGLCIDARSESRSTPRPTWSRSRSARWASADRRALGRASCRRAWRRSTRTRSSSPGSSRAAPPRSPPACAAPSRCPTRAAWIDVREDAERLLTRLYQRPGLNLDEDALQERLARLDERSVQRFAEAARVTQ